MDHKSINEEIKKAIRKTEELLNEIPGSDCPQQFDNPVQQFVNPVQQFANPVQQFANPTKKKLALIIGINYRGTEKELSGINDASDLLHKLVQDFGFNQSNIQLLIEEVATRKNILDGLERLVRELEPGDIGVFTYAGHGTQTADLPPIDEDDMLDEAIVPIDALSDRSNLIRDDEIQEILSKLAHDVHFVVIFDSCHSATGTRAQEYGALVETATREHKKLSKRFIPPTPTIKEIKEIMSDIKINNRDVSEHPLTGPNHILLAGCKANEVAFDDLTNGYFTKALIKHMEKGISYQELYDIVRGEVLNSSNNAQEPQLDGPDFLTKMNIFE
ncbi:caspase family protein [Bacillus songklensis]|uniref:Caspase family protein n=1 Tax=Bacillus songklensis TaxID=1069116 RepID=A0ABV8B7R5_9BACI